MRIQRLFGLARSLGIYYGIPLRARQLTRFYAQFITPNSLCFDIGAHAGDRIRCWRRLNARVVAVEPQRDFVRLLRLLYGRDRNVVIVPGAVGSCAGRVKILISERTPTVSTISEEWMNGVRDSAAFRGVVWSHSDEVEMTTLQLLIERHGIPKFAKIDVEGSEAQVLAGLTVAIPSLSFEFIPAARPSAQACIHRLESLGAYRYNWSRGESHRLGETVWLDSAGIGEFIAESPEHAGSADIYAQLKSG